MTLQKIIIIRIIESEIDKKRMSWLWYRNKVDKIFVFPEYLDQRTIPFGDVIDNVIKTQRLN